MRILAFSDISWNSVHLRELTGKIERIHPDLVLLAGDLVNDMIGLRDGKFFSIDNYWDEVYEYRVRQILNYDLYVSLISTSLRLFFFFTGFVFLNRLAEVLPAFRTKVGSEWIGSVSVMVGGIFLASLLYNTLHFGVRWFTEKSWTDLDDIFVGLVTGPMVVIVVAGTIYVTLGTFPDYFKQYVDYLWHYITDEILLRMIFIVVTTWLATFIFDRIVVYSLRKWADSTEQKYDDMFVRIFQVFGDFLIIAMGIGIILVNFQPQITAATAGSVDNIILPYSVVVSVFSAILGYASREAIENFFGGVLLQIDKPFEKGERLVLETGEICDVREIGMRSTTLYNVVENVLISIPNSVMSGQKITNTSRPDWQLRIQLRLPVAQDGDTLSRAEEILLDIAYLDGEIDQLRVTEAELSPQLVNRNRKSVKEQVLLLARLHPQIKDTVISQIIGGGKTKDLPVFAEASGNQLAQGGGIIQRLDRITALRQQYVDIVEENRTLFFRLRDKLNKQLPLDVAETDLEQLIYEIVQRVVYAEFRGGKEEKPDPLIVIKEVSERERIGSEDGETQSGYPLQSALFDVCTMIDGADRTHSNSIDSAIQCISEHLARQDKMRMSIMRKIADNVAWVDDAVFTVADVHREARRDMDAVIGELGKEPTVHSRFLVTEEGKGYIEINFNVYTTHLERRFEVINKLNREIQKRFRDYAIKLGVE